MRYLWVIPFLVLLMFLPSCIDQKGQISQDTKNDIKELVKDALSSLPTPTINVPPNQTVDTASLRENIRQDVRASVDNNAAQMTGAVNASVNKIANEITGVKAELGKLLEINNNLYMQLNSNITTNLSAQANVSAELRSNIQAISKITMELDAKVSVVASLNATLQASMKIQNEMKVQLDANASAVAGIANRVDNINATAGHDVNMLPATAVYMIVVIMALMAAVATVAISLAFKSAKDRAQLAAVEEREESRWLYGLLAKAIAFVPGHHAENITKELSEGRGQLPLPLNSSGSYEEGSSDP